MPRRTKLTRLLANSLALVAVLLPVLISGCPQAARWRDAQIAESQNIAKGDAVVAPPQPVVVPKKVAAELPLDDSFVITQYTATNGTDSVSVSALSPWDTEQTAMWMLSELGRLKYQSDENPSELLNGLVCFSTDRKYNKLTATVTMNNSGQCLIKLEAAKE